MNGYLGFWQIILQCLIVFLGLYLSFFKSYFQEKGKSLATKQDIEEITARIEVVKSDIGILTQKKINLSAEKSRTLLDFIGKFMSYLNFISNTNIHTIDIKRLVLEGRIDDLVNTLAVAEANLDVFFNNDDELLSVKDNLVHESLLLQNHFTYSMVIVESISNQIGFWENLKNGGYDNEYKSNEVKKLNERLIDSHKEYQEEKLKIYKTVSRLYHQLARMIYDRLHEFEKK